MERKCGRSGVPVVVVIICVVWIVLCVLVVLYALSLTVFRPDEVESTDPIKDAMEQTVRSQKELNAALIKLMVAEDEMLGREPLAVRMMGYKGVKVCPGGDGD